LNTDRRAEHLRAWEALPWVVNGRATPEQAQWVAQHLAGCEDCRAEFAWQQRLRDAMAAPADVEAADAARAAETTEAGLRRLLARLDEPAALAPLPARGVTRLTWALAAAVVLQAVGLGVMSLQLGSQNMPQADYQTLTDPPASAAAASLRVLPDPAMRLADWQALLQAEGLQVVSGPNAAGAYALAPAVGQAPAPLKQTLENLRRAPGVRLAEPIGPAP
jgi:Putative zinc-finger